MLVVAVNSRTDDRGFYFEKTSIPPHPLMTISSSLPPTGATARLLSSVSLKHGVAFSDT